MIKKVSLEKLNSYLSQNIQKIHNKSKGSESIKHLSPLYAGGYPMSLLFAPRMKGEVDKIDGIYYSDYDIYFEETAQAEEAVKILTEYALEENYTSENATTLKVKFPSDPEGTYETFQIVHKVSGSPESILPTFDFVNCAVAFAPSSNAFYMHKEAPKCHSDRILDILNPWMVTDALKTGTPIQDNVIIQLLRFKKYCHRWEYCLSDKSFDLLIKAYEAFPDIIVPANHPIRVRGGAYSGQEYYAWRNQNLWKAVASLVGSHKAWEKYEDQIGYITSALPEQSVREELTTSQIPF